MTTLDLTNYALDAPLRADTDSCQNRFGDQAQAIKRAMSAYRKVLRSGLPTTAWGRTIRISSAAQAGTQDLTGCGCGCS